MRPHLLPDIHDWPVYILAKNRAEFVDKVIQDMEVQVERVGAGELDQMLSKTIFQERQRVKSNPWKADPPNESLFFKNCNVNTMRIRNLMIRFRRINKPRAD